MLKKYKISAKFLLQDLAINARSFLSITEKLIAKTLAGYKLITYICNTNKHKIRIMPVLFIFFGLRFMFFSNDHEPIHVHAVKGKGSIKENAKFVIEPEVKLVENNGLQANEIKLAEMVIEENKEIIAEKWNEFFNK